jgi:putative endopeptidase
MKSYKLAILTGALALAGAPALAQTAAPSTAAATAASRAPAIGTWGFDLSGMDRSVKPGDDFFRFANGAWYDRTEIPAERAAFGAFYELLDLSDTRVRTILEDAAAGKLQDPDAAKIAAAYKAFMDEALIERLDAKPIQPELAQVRAVKTKDEFTSLMGKANTSGFASILPVFITIDSKAPTRYAVGATTGGLGLPDRDYYLQPSFAEQKAKYQAYVQQMLTLIGWENPAANAKAIVDFETKLAEASWSRAEERDRDKTYNPMSPAELNAATPGFDWVRYLREGQLAGVDRVIVGPNTAFPKFAKIYADTPLPTLKAWQAFQVTDGAAPYLSKRFVDARFEFRNKTLSGQPQQRARWKRGADYVNALMGESVGRVYVARHFTPDAKAKMDVLVQNLLGAMKTRIETLQWMGPETKARGLEKLAKFDVKIGYPEKWRDYSALTIRADDPYGNQIRGTAFEFNRQRARLNSPVDEAEWYMTPQTVNAYYTYQGNEIVFPAAILQAPMFDPNADPAVNYGAIGAIIGHEISHGFDDQGRKSDGDGVLREWWTEADEAKFNAEAAKLGAQYSAFEPFPGAKVNGTMTMGENIGDLAGLSIALDAYRASLGGRPAPASSACAWASPRPGARSGGKPRCASSWWPTSTPPPSTAPTAPSGTSRAGTRRST